MYFVIHNGYLMKNVFHHRDVFDNGHYLTFPTYWLKSAKGNIRTASFSCRESCVQYSRGKLNSDFVFFFSKKYVVDLVNSSSSFGTAYANLIRLLQPEQSRLRKMVIGISKPSFELVYPRADIERCMDILTELNESQVDLNYCISWWWPVTSYSKRKYICHRRYPFTLVIHLLSKL